MCLLSPEPVVHCTAALHLSYRKEREGEREGVRGCLRYFMSVTIAKRNYPLSIPPSPPSFLTRARTALAVVLEVNVARILPTTVSPG